MPINAFFDPEDPTLAYKQDVGGPEGGPFAASYSTSFFNTPSDPADATISYISGPKITAEDIYLLVKDGNHDPTGYLFDISGMEWRGESHLLPGSGRTAEPYRMCRYIRSGALPLPPTVFPMVERR